MSETSQGPGWWLASDGRWYPPTTASGAAQTWTQQQPQYGVDPFGYPVASAPSHKKRRSSRRSTLTLVIVLVLVAAGAGGYEFWKHKSHNSGTSFATGTPIGKGFICSQIGNHREFLTWSTNNGTVHGFYETTAGDLNLSGTQSGNTVTFDAGKSKATSLHLTGSITGTTLHLNIPIGLTKTSTICTLDPTSKVKFHTGKSSTPSTSKSSTSTTLKTGSSGTDGSASAKAELMDTLNAAKSIYATAGRLAFNTGTGDTKAQTPGTLQAQLRSLTANITFLRKTATPGAHSVGVWPVKSYSFVAVALDATGGCWVASFFNATPSAKATPTTGTPPSTQFSWLTGKAPKDCNAQSAASEITNQSSGSVPWTTSFAKITTKP